MQEPERPGSSRVARPTLAKRYGLAILSGVAALVLTATLRGWLGQTIYLFFYPAVMVTAGYGGFGPGALVGAIGALAASYLFLDPVGSVKISDLSQLATVCVLLASAWLVDALNRRLLHARLEAEHRATQAEALSRTLEEQFVENEALLEELQGKNEELQQAAVDADAANRAKSTFLATMSHELRTPLNAIDGYAELLEMGIYGPVSQKQTESIRRIRYSHDVLLSLIDQVLDQAKLEAGKLQLEIAPFAVEEVVRIACTLMEPQAQASGLRVEARCHGSRLLALGDRARVQQILLNLLSNSLKFTPRGGRVVLECGTAGRQVLMSVTDTGQGIPSDKQAMIFEPFVQADQSPTRVAGGAGLGLAISRDLARAMRGDLTVTSAPGEGSTFVLALPIATD